ncbi:MAG: penicillin-binding transpeptidase domain-containing protein [Fibromonadales bacterium]|nr:penicillin-binding transpeptidase domain-containing protein [Fibromonadales bacterium]
MKTRLMIIGFLLSMTTVAIVARLAKIQLVRDEIYYEDKTQSREYKEANFGRVLDRNGTVLWHKLLLDGKSDSEKWKEIYYHEHLEGLSAILNGVVNSKIRLLRGQKGVSRTTIKPGKNTPIDETELTPLIEGKDVHLSIDLRIQEIVENTVREYVPKFGAAGASVLVMDPRTGQILAITSFNPEKKKYENVLHSFEPGSIFKPITAVIALESGVDPNKTINTEEGKWQVSKNANEKIIKDSHPRESCNMQEAMVYSSNIAFGKYVVEEMGYENFFYGVKKFAINEAYEFPLRISHKGFSRVLDFRTQAAQGFGQSIDATSLDIAKAFGSIANGGILYNPKLILEYGKDSAATERDSIRKVISSTENARLLREMLKGVVEKGGTAENVKSKYDFFEFAGKTGTAQIRDSSGKYTHELYNSSFIGMESATDPHYICLVTMYNTKRAGATVAGPVFQKIMEQIYLHPSLSPVAFAREYAPADSLCNDVSFVGYTKQAAENKASGLRCTVRFDDASKTGSVVAQTIKKDSSGEYLELSLREYQRNTGLMPDVRGLALRDALGMLEHISNVTYEGVGKVYEQFPAPGSIAGKSSTVRIRLREGV